MPCLYYCGLSGKKGEDEIRFHNQFNKVVFGRRKMVKIIRDSNCFLMIYQGVATSIIGNIKNDGLYGAFEIDRPLLEDIRMGDICFLLNVVTDEIIGTYVAVSSIGIFNSQLTNTKGVPLPVQLKINALHDPIVKKGAIEQLKNIGVKFVSSKKGLDFPHLRTFPPQITARIIESFQFDINLDNEIPTELYDVVQHAEDAKSPFLEDIIGLAKAKKFIIDRIIAPLRAPRLAKIYNLAIGGGLLLIGPPGTGKTLLAKATAKEINAELVEIHPSDVRGYAGQGEERIAEKFKRACEAPRGVIFIDEAEAILAKKVETSTVSQRIRATLLHLFSEIFYTREKRVLIIGATNAPWYIDDAFLRPGRFDEKIFVDLPDEESIIQMIKKKNESRKLIMNLNEDDIRKIAKLLYEKHYSGADIEDMLYECALVAYQKTLEVNPRIENDVELGNGEIYQYYGNSQLVTITIKDIENIIMVKTSSFIKDHYDKLLKWCKERNIV